MLLQCAAVCCSALQCVAACWNVLWGCGNKESPPTFSGLFRQRVYPRSHTRTSHAYMDELHSVKHSDTVQQGATRCNTMRHVVTHCNSFTRTSHAYMNVLHSVKHCGTMQQGATRCNTMRHIATHCNAVTLCKTLQHPVEITVDGREICVCAWSYLSMQRKQEIRMNACELQVCVRMNLLEYEWERRCMCEWVWTREACVCECLHMSLHGRQWRTCLQRKWHTSPILWILTVNRQEDQIKMHRGNVDMSTFSLPRTVNEESENTYLYYNTLQHTATHCNTLQHHDNVNMSTFDYEQ